MPHPEGLYFYCNILNQPVKLLVCRLNGRKMNYKP